MCDFSLQSSECCECECFGDCLDENIPLDLTPTASADGPLKLIVPHCKTHRQRAHYRRGDELDTPDDPQASAFYAKCRDAYETTGRPWREVAR